MSCYGAGLGLIGELVVHPETVWPYGKIATCVEQEHLET